MITYRFFTNSDRRKDPDLTRTLLAKTVYHIILLLAVSIPFKTCAYALEPYEILPNPQLEKRARNISKSLRCLVCQNQSIDDSNADLAKELRLIVRERIGKGDTDSQVVRYITDRYGDYVLLQPPVNIKTLGLWAIPAILLCLAMFIAYRFLTKTPTDTVALSKREQRILQTILQDKKDD